MTFQLTQTLDVGTENPIVARLTIGLFDIIQMTELPKEKQEQIIGGCFDIMRDLIQAEKSAKPLIEELRAINLKLATEGVKTQSEGRVIETPGVLLLDNSRIFLKFAKQALQHLAKVLGILLEKDFRGPHFHKVLERAKEKLGDEHIVTKLLEEDQSWLKDINNLRNEDEHPSSGKRFLQGYSISRLDNGKFLIEPPRFFNGTQVQSALEVYSHNLLTFSEELIAHTLEDFLPEMVRVYDIPEEQRDPTKPIRYHIGFKKGFGGQAPEAKE